MPLHDCHTHVFTNRIVPARFLPLGLIRLLTRRPFSRGLAWLLNRLNPFSNDDLFDRYAAFMEIGSAPSQLAIFEGLLPYYPANTRFVVLMMDMEFMAAGGVRQPFEEQLDELGEVKAKYPDRVLPFIAVDPRRPGIADTVRNAVEHRGFAGIKLYPPLGYYPFDKRLDPVYAYAEEREIPVVSHCSRGGVCYRGVITDDMLTHPKDPTWNLKRKQNSEFCDYFADPRNYEYVLDAFPRLNLCLAHFGGNVEWAAYLDHPARTDIERSWVSTILDLIRDERWPNVYADVSYVMHDARLHPLLKAFLQDPIVRKQVLYGSDFYMVQTEIPGRAYRILLRAHLGHADFTQIAEVNPERFLAPSR